MIKEIISSWEAIAWNGTVASWVVAQVWPISMSMHSMSFSFVSKKTGSRGELLLCARLGLATERFQVGVNELAT